MSKCTVKTYTQPIALLILI